MKILIYLITLFLMISLNSCVILYHYYIPSSKLEVSDTFEDCGKLNKVFSIKTLFNMSRTKPNGDTIVKSIKPVERINMYNIEDYHEALRAYLEEKGITVFFHPPDYTTNGIDLQSELKLVQEEEGAFIANSGNDTTFVYWVVNFNTSIGTDGSLYGSIDRYEIMRLASYCLVFREGKLCFSNGIETVAHYGPGKPFYRKSVRKLFDPLFEVK